MSLARTLERHSPDTIALSDRTDSDILGWNRQVYQRLQLALRLGLRHQVFFAICDDLALRNRLALRLQWQLDNSEDNQVPSLVSLNVEPQQPDFSLQIEGWMARNRTEDTSNIGFQILGIERLTRASAGCQWAFLNSLREMPDRLLGLDATLLLWLPRPWLYAIAESVPEFWRCCTGVFEFQGEPTPASPSLEQQWHIENGELMLRPVGANGVCPSETEKTEDTQERAKALRPYTSPIDRAFADEIRASGEANAIALLRRLEKLYQLESPPTLLAQVFQQLGDFYRDRSQNGIVAAINTAISAYEKAREWTQRSAPLDFHRETAVLNELGTLYWTRSRRQASLEAKLPDLERAAIAYQGALTHLDPESQPEAWGMLHNNIGAIYGELARCTNQADNFQRSIAAFEEALRYRSAEGEPQQYAATQNNLGTAYWSLAQHRDPVANLEKAIAAYTEASGYYHCDREPLNYAMLKNNIGTAYWNLTQYRSDEKLLHQAIAAYREALIYRTPEVLPAGSAATQNNLGTAYWHLASYVKEEEKEYHYALEQAIAAYEMAIAIAANIADTPLTFDIWATHNSLALAHYQIATDERLSLGRESRHNHLEIALHHHTKAWEGWQAKPERAEAAIGCLVQTVRAFYNEGDINNQNRAFSQLPPQVLPEIMRRL